MVDMLKPNSVRGGVNIKSDAYTVCSLNPPFVYFITLNKLVDSGGENCDCYIVIPR